MHNDKDLLTVIEFFNTKIGKGLSLEKDSVALESNSKGRTYETVLYNQKALGYLIGLKERAGLQILLIVKTYKQIYEIIAG